MNIVIKNEDDMIIRQEFGIVFSLIRGAGDQGGSWIAADLQELLRLI